MRTNTSLDISCTGNYYHYFPINGFYDQVFCPQAKAWLSFRARKGVVSQILYLQSPFFIKICILQEKTNELDMGILEKNITLL
jgi:hypothetical protein